MEKKMSDAIIEKMAYEIRRFLIVREMWVDVTIYFNGKALSADDRKGTFAYNDPDKVIVLEDQDPKKFFAFAGGVLSMSFEGDFYDVMNYDCWPAAHSHFVKLLAKYGCHYELGNAWNLSVYQD